MPMRSSSFGCASFVLGTSLLLAHPQPARATLTLTPCQPPRATEEVLCGSLAVPEDRAHPGGRAISLHIVLLPALDPQAQGDPIFYLEGGPGVAATGTAGLFTGELRDYRAHHAVVLVDQRGTGQSNGLACAKQGGPLARALATTFPVEYVRRCRAAAERHADLRFYTTAMAAEDLDAVRAALGYDRIELLGLSYGTRLAQVYARAQPAHVSRLVLWGATPVWAALPLHHAENAQRAFEQLFADCAADRDCARVHPDLRARFTALVARLRARPATIARGGERAMLDGDRLVEALRAMLYTPLGARQVPAMIEDVAAARYEPLLAQLAQEAPIDDGMYLSVTCAEDVPRITDADAARDTAGTWAGDYRIREQRRACAAWPHGEVPAGFWDGPSFAAPALLLAGDRDPVTPPAWAEAIAAHLPHATVLHVPWDAHLPIGLTGLECFDRVSVAFLDRGTLDGVDTGCLARMMPPPFAR